MSRGGGLLLAFDAELPSQRRADLEPPCEIMVCVFTPPGSSKIAVILCYRPPSSHRAAFNECIELTLSCAAAEFRDIVVLGDFNLPDIDWRNADCVNCRGQKAMHLRQTEEADEGHYYCEARRNSSVLKLQLQGMNGRRNLLWPPWSTKNNFNVQSQKMHDKDIERLAYESGFTTKPRGPACCPTA
ncbi:hypothetical protein CAPTEDRAFT_192129 [Capitella teleta]|uniref:Ig-like domain-containing protein n=1 Tax=Capitella teleta TaxID=283909 RepID=R7V843_CAPTE|nr:hypothetical protein CAPTEDRAFT_192129 [Capitella teleta]|eukprot:ELU15038.1 hypothetical protein CAPTEDRAFT_192129 [Capitella teleta]